MTELLQLLFDFEEGFFCFVGIVMDDCNVDNRAELQYALLE